MATSVRTKCETWLYGALIAIAVSLTYQVRQAHALQVGGGGVVSQVIAYTTPGSFNYYPPTGYAMLRVLACGGGGGGGAATSGGGLAHGGGGGGAGLCAECYVSYQLSSFPIIVGAGGSAGTCGAAPTVAGDGTQSEFYGALCEGSYGSHGLTASTIANGNGGNGGANTSFATMSAGWNPAQFGGGAPAGTTATAGGVGGNINGPPGGHGAAVTGAGVCNVPATNGANGFVIVEAIP